MLSTKRVSQVVFGYGLFLLLTGLIGYEVTSEHSTSALFNGSVFGSLLMMLGILHRMGRMWTLPASVSAAAIFSLTFLWRSALQWMLVAGGETQRSGIAALLSIMALVSIAVTGLLARTYRH